MITLVVVTLALMGGTIWVALDQPMAARPELQRRLSRVGLTLSLLAVLTMTVGGIVTSQ